MGLWERVFRKKKDGGRGRPLETSVAADGDESQAPRTTPEPGARPLQVTVIFVLGMAPNNEDTLVQAVNELIGQYRTTFVKQPDVVVSPNANTNTVTAMIRVGDIVEANAFKQAGESIFRKHGLRP
jgi:hypothetical protein